MRNLWCSVNKGGFKCRIKPSSTSAFHSFPFVFQLASTQPALQIGQGLSQITEEACRIRDKFWKCVYCTNTVLFRESLLMIYQGSVNFSHSLCRTSWCSRLTLHLSVIHQAAGAYLWELDDSLGMR